MSRTEPKSVSAGPCAAPRARRGLDAASTALFLAALAAPALGALLRPGAAEASVRAEQRQPAPLPGRPGSLRDAARLPNLLKTWHDDHLGLRDLMLETRSRILLGVLGISPTSSAVIGPDGWLWFAGESSLPAWRGSAPLWPSHVEQWARVYRDRAAWCRAHGIAYVAALAPNKMEIYPERVPPPWSKIGPSRYDQVSTALSADGPEWFLDLRAELRDERRNDTPEDYTYSRRGTHWTTRAALRGGAAMLARARAAGVDVEIPRRSDFEFTPYAFDDDSWSGQLHLPDLPKEVQPLLTRNLGRRWRPNHPLDAVPKRVETLTGVDELPRLWIVHDSFGAALRPMLAPYFSRATYDWKPLGDFDPPAMEEFAPHVVLDLHTERQVFRAPPALIASRDEAETIRRFERAGEPVWTLAGSAARARAEPGTICTVEESGLRLQAVGRGGGVVLPDVDLGVRGTAILRLEVDAERGGPLYVQTLLVGQAGWRSAPGVERPLRAGSQVLWVEYTDPRARGPIRVGLPTATGVVRLLAAEVRSAGW